MGARQRYDGWIVKAGFEHPARTVGRNEIEAALRHEQHWDWDCALPCPGYSLPTTKRRPRAAPAGWTIILTRRKFGTTLVAGAALATSAQQARPQPASNRTIVDAQVHFWKANSPDWAWDPGARPQLPEPFTIERALPMMDEAGVDRVVIVPPGLNDRNDYALEAAKRYPNRFEVMGYIPLQRHGLGDGTLDPCAPEMGLIASLGGAPRSMKMGTTLSPWRYDAAASHALQSAILRRPAILRYAWLPDDVDELAHDDDEASYEW